MADDIETFLVILEHVVEVVQWDQDTKVMWVAPLLTGEAQGAYPALGSEVAQD